MFKINLNRSNDIEAVGKISICEAFYQSFRRNSEPNFIRFSKGFDFRRQGSHSVVLPNPLSGHHLRDSGELSSGSHDAEGR